MQTRERKKRETSREYKTSVHETQSGNKGERENVRTI